MQNDIDGENEVLQYKTFLHSTIGNNHLYSMHFHLKARGEYGHYVKQFF